MDYKQNFQERKEELNCYFVNAIELGASLQQYNEVVNIEQLVTTLQSHQKNWEDNRFEIVVVGEFSTGKSTFINALLQREILPSKVTPTTATVNFIRSIDDLKDRENDEPVAKVVYMAGNEVIVPYEQLADYVTEMSQLEDVSKNIHHVDLYVDSPYLKNGVVIVDTPGLQALNPAHEKITRAQIKKSNASIILFNMEQQGKQTEFKFLQSLKESIDRIFFVSNRLDAVPPEEVAEVIEQLERTLVTNDYQTIPAAMAKVHPVSALKALKARDQQVKTMHWEQSSAAQLLEESRFETFEQRLEQYLFEGEQAEDFLAAPYEKIEQFYTALLQQFKEYQVHLESNDNLEEIEQQFKRAQEEAEMRNMQLKQEITRLKGTFNDVVRTNEKEYNAAIEQLVHDVKNDVEAIAIVEDFEDVVNSAMMDFNNYFQQVFDTKLQDLAMEINDVMRKEINDFELKIEHDTTTKQHHIQVRTQASHGKSYEDVVKETELKFAEREAELREDAEQLREKIRLEAELQYMRQEKKDQEASAKDDMRFQELLINSTPQTKETYGTIKERRFWFDKKGMVSEDNENYDQLVREKRNLKKEHEAQQAELRHKEKELVIATGQNNSNYSNHEELREERQELREQKNQELMHRLNEQLKQSDRELQQQRRKVMRELTNIATGAKRDYRAFLRGLDTLDIAQQKIDDYIQRQDRQLIEVQQRALRLEQQKTNSETERANIHTEIENISQKIEHELTALELTRI